MTILFYHLSVQNNKKHFVMTDPELIYKQFSNRAFNVPTNSTLYCVTNTTNMPGDSI